MNKRTRRAFAAFFAAALIVSVSASANTVLLFEDTSSSSLFTSDLATYGDRVTANTQAGYRYGGTADTPNIVADFPSANGWPSFYGDLTNVIYTQATNGILRAKLTADAGYNVALQSFDLAGYPQADYTINSVKVFDGNGNALFSQSGVLVQGDNNGPRHTTISFAPLVAQVIDIQIDASNITAAFGAEDCGLDNLQFAQLAAVPEPSSIALAALGLFAIGSSRKLRRSVFLGRAAVRDPASIRIAFPAVSTATGSAR